MNNDLLNNLQKWHDDDEFQRIVDAIEAIPENERDYNLKGLLARAYNNINEYQKALDLLLEIKNEGLNDISWHFRAGYAYFFLDQFEQAKQEFKYCLEFEPDDEDSLMFLLDCNDALHFGTYLDFSSKKSTVTSFLKRCDEFWNRFCENEATLIDLIKNQAEYGPEKIVEFISELTDIISKDIQFNIGGDNEFTFMAEGKSHRFYLMPYLISRMPDSLKEKWHFSPFSPGADGHDFDFQMYEKKVKISDVKVHIDFDKDNRTFSVMYFNEKLNELDYDDNINAFCIMMEIMIGEAISYMYISEVDKSDNITDTMFPLTELKSNIIKTLTENNITTIDRPDQNYCVYRRDDVDDSEFRLDTKIGTSCYNELVSDFFKDKTNNYDNLLEYGAFPLYIAVSYHENKDTLPEDEKQLLNLRYELEDKIQSGILGEQGSGNETGIILGGAMGDGSFYIDLLLFDMENFEEKLTKLIEEEYNLSFYLFNFRRGHKV